MSKEQFRRSDGSFHSGHRKSGGSETVSFDFVKTEPFGEIKIVATLKDDSDGERRFVELRHGLMDVAVESLIDWLKENKR